MKAEEARRVHPSLTSPQSVVIVLYSTEDAVREHSVYYVLNGALREVDRQRIKPWRHFIWLLLQGLRKLPKLRETSYFYRGVRRSAADLGLSPLPPSLNWYGFSSTARSVDVMTTPAFLGDTGDRTLFQVRLDRDGLAFDIGAFSFFPDENEGESRPHDLWVTAQPCPHFFCACRHHRNPELTQSRPALAALLPPNLRLVTEGETPDFLGSVGLRLIKCRVDSTNDVLLHLDPARR